MAKNIEKNTMVVRHLTELVVVVALVNIVEVIGFIKIKKDYKKCLIKKGKYDKMKMKYDKIIEIDEKERWCVNYEKQIVLRQEYRPDYQYLYSKPYWHDDLVIKIENLKKVVDNL